MGSKPTPTKMVDRKVAEAVGMKLKAADHEYICVALVTRLPSRFRNLHVTLQSGKKVVNLVLQLILSTCKITFKETNQENWHL